MIKLNMSHNYNKLYDFQKTTNAQSNKHQTLNCQLSTVNYQLNYVLRQKNPGNLLLPPIVPGL